MMRSILTHNPSISFDREQDSEVIEEILRCNRGSIERTIDQLLSISSDNQVSLIDFLIFYQLICIKSERKNHAWRRGAMQRRIRIIDNFQATSVCFENTRHNKCKSSNQNIIINGESLEQLISMETRSAAARSRLSSFDERWVLWWVRCNATEWGVSRWVEVRLIYLDLNFN